MCTMQMVSTSLYSFKSVVLKQHQTWVWWAEGTFQGQSRGFSSVQFSCSVMSDSLWPHELQQPGLPVHHQLLEFTQTHAHQVGDAIQPSHPLSPPSPPAPIPPSIRVFSNEPTLRMRWPKYSSVSFSISPSNEHPGLISFRMDWLLGASSCLSPSHRSTCRHVLLITSSNILPSTKTKYCVINFHFNCALGVYLCHWFSLNSLCSFLVWKLANIMDSLVYLN